MTQRRKRRSTSPLMRHYCNLIAAELLSWPHVSSRKMFGLTLFYRGKLPFVALPETLDFSDAESVGFRLHAASEVDRRAMQRHPSITAGRGAKWINFALREESDLGEFLRWAEKAYESCRKP